MQKCNIMGRLPEKHIAYAYNAHWLDACINKLNTSTQWYPNKPRIIYNWMLQPSCGREKAHNARTTNSRRKVHAPVGYNMQWCTVQHGYSRKTDLQLYNKQPWASYNYCVLRTTQPSTLSGKENGVVAYQLHELQGEDQVWLTGTVVCLHAAPQV